MKTTSGNADLLIIILELGNQVQAAIRAGYSERYARDQAFKILEMPAVKEYYEDRPTGDRIKTCCQYQRGHGISYLCNARAKKQKK